MNKTIRMMALPCLAVALLTAVAAEAAPHGGPDGRGGPMAPGGRGCGPAPRMEPRGGCRPAPQPQPRDFGSRGGCRPAPPPQPRDFGPRGGCRPMPPPPPCRPEPRFHHHNDGGAFVAGFFGGILADAFFAPPPPPPPVGHYVDQVQTVWVEGRWVDTLDGFGRPVRAWQAGHYENQTTRVWVQY